MVTKLPMAILHNVLQLYATSCGVRMAFLATAGLLVSVTLPLKAVSQQWVLGNIRYLTQSDRRTFSFESEETTDYTRSCRIQCISFWTALFWTSSLMYLIAWLWVVWTVQTRHREIVWFKCELELAVFSEQPGPISRFPAVLCNVIIIRGLQGCASRMWMSSCPCMQFSRVHVRTLNRYRRRRCYSAAAAHHNAARTDDVLTRWASIYRA